MGLSCPAGLFVSLLDLNSGQAGARGASRAAVLWGPEGGHPPQQAQWALLPSPRKAPSAAITWHFHGHALVAPSKALLWREIQKKTQHHSQVFFLASL
jgi:hypothetical protein